MKQFRKSVVQALVAGILLMVPLYLAVLVLLKAMKSVGRVVRPLARLLPQSFPAESVMSLLLLLLICLLVGMVLRTSMGEAARSRIESSFLKKVPGYEIFRSLTRQLAGQSYDDAWRPALAEIEEALVPAFIVEELDGGRFTVFVPSAPTPLAGAIYILTAARVHPLNVPFTQVIKAIAHWGAGSKELVHAIERTRIPSTVVE